MVWVKPGADESLFAQDRSACVQESSRSVSGSADQNLFAACMKQKGWGLQKEQLILPPAPPDSGPLQEVFLTLKTDKEKRCVNPAYLSFFSKTACDPQDITASQIADKKNATADEKAVLLKLKMEMQDSQKRALSAYRQYGGESGERSARVLESWQIFNDKNITDLYEGKQTWGDYNRSRKGLSAQLSEALKKTNNAR